MNENDREKLIEGFKKIQFEKFNLCEIDLADAQGVNLMFVIEDTIKSTMNGMDAYYTISKIRQ